MQSWKELLISGLLNDSEAFERLKDFFTLYVKILYFTYFSYIL